MDDQEQRIEKLQERIEQLELAISSLMEFISIDGATLSIRAKGDISIEAANLMASAANCAKIQGRGSAELKASGQVIVEGAIVKIN